MGTVISIFVAIVALVFSCVSFRRSHKTSIKPILIFSNDAFNDKSTTTWFVENVGNGPALNVILCGGKSLDMLHVDVAVVIPALATGTKEKLDFLPQRVVLVAKYADVYGGKYTSTCSNNENRLVERDIFPDLTPSCALHQIQLEHRDKNEQDI